MHIYSIPRTKKLRESMKHRKYPWGKGSFLNSVSTSGVMHAKYQNLWILVLGVCHSAGSIRSGLDSELLMVPWRRFECLIQLRWSLGPGLQTSRQGFFIFQGSCEIGLLKIFYLYKPRLFISRRSWYCLWFCVATPNSICLGTRTYCQKNQSWDNTWTRLDPSLIGFTCNSSWYQWDDY